MISPKARLEFYFSSQSSELGARGLVFGSPGHRKNRSSVEELKYSFNPSSGLQIFADLNEFSVYHFPTEDKRIQCMKDLGVSLVDSLKLSSYSAADIASLVAQQATDQNRAVPSDSHAMKAAMMSNTLHGSSLMLIYSKEGRTLVGLCNATRFQDGDVVCGVLGCNSPLVVRRKKDGDRIVGQCLDWGLWQWSSY